MKRRGGTGRYTAEEAAAARRKDRARTDWSKVDATTEAELEASIAAEGEEAGGPPDWTQAVKGVPPPKEPIKLRIDADVLAWFRATGKGYQTRINNVLRAFVESRRQAGR